MKDSSNPLSNEGTMGVVALVPGLKLGIKSILTYVGTLTTPLKLSDMLIFHYEALIST